MSPWCWLGITECGSHATSAMAANVAPEVDMGDPFLYAVTWLVGVLVVQQALLRRR
jgi:hypothetical protein